MPNNPVSTHYPQQLLGQEAAVALKELYDIDWQSLRVVRQTKHRPLGSLEFIDYAVPCFELTGRLTEAPDGIAKNLEQALQAKNHPLFRVEAVGGYLNFQLNEDYVNQLLIASRYWLAKPQLLVNGGSNKYVIVGKSLAKAEAADLTDSFYRCLEDVSRILGSSLNADYLLSDYSEATLAYLAELSAQGPVSQPHGRGGQRRNDILRSEKGNLLAQLRDAWDAEQSNGYSVIAESSLNQEVQDFFNQLPGSPHNNGIIKDVATGAAYYLEGDEATPLRSMSGLLYRSAYILYVVQKQLLASPPNQKIVVIAPQKTHSLLYDRARYLWERQQTQARVVCFDPIVSKADITDIQKNITSLAHHLWQLGELLGGLPQDYRQQPIKRIGLLSLIDLPIELSQQLANAQLPPLFDTLNQSIWASKLLGSQHPVQITTN